MNDTRAKADITEVGYYEASLGSGTVLGVSASRLHPLGRLILRRLLYCRDDYYQALPWEYSFNAYHDLQTTISCMGGPARLPGQDSPIFPVGSPWILDLQISLNDIFARGGVGQDGWTDGRMG